nr:putative transporter mfs2 [Quercus suber]
MLNWESLAPEQRCDCNGPMLVHFWINGTHEATTIGQLGAFTAQWWTAMPWARYDFSANLDSTSPSFLYLSSHLHPHRFTHCTHRCTDMSGQPSRTPSAWSKDTGKDFETPATTTPDTRSEFVAENGEAKGEIGQVVGGIHTQSNRGEQGPSTNHGPLQEVEVDMPLTLTQRVKHEGKEYIVLNFVDGDSENPFNWNPWYKRSIATMLNLMTLFIGLATTAYSSGINSMVAELGASNEEGQLGLFTFNIACAIAPLLLAPFCELAGRKVVYAGAYFCFTILFIGLALGQNIETILVLRLLLGLFGCVGTILVGGTFDDMYEPRERGRPMAMFSFVAIFGTVAAPIYAGFIDETLGWRWIEGIQGLSNIPLLICVFLFFPETRGGARLHARAKKLRKATGDVRYVASDDIYTPSLQSMLQASSVKARRRCRPPLHLALRRHLPRLARAPAADAQIRAPGRRGRIRRRARRARVAAVRRHVRRADAADRPVHLQLHAVRGAQLGGAGGGAGAHRVRHLLRVREHVQLHGRLLRDERELRDRGPGPDAQHPRRRHPALRQPVLPQRRQPVRRPAARAARDAAERHPLRHVQVRARATGQESAGAGVLKKKALLWLDLHVVCSPPNIVTLSYRPQNSLVNFPSIAYDSIHP